MARSAIVLLVAAVAGGLLGLAFGALAGSRYRATTSVLLLAPQTPNTNDQDPQRRVDTVGLIAQSRAYAAQVAKSAGLETAAVRRDLAATVQPNTNVLNFAATASSPDAAQRLANAAADDFAPFVRQVTGEFGTVRELDPPDRAQSIGPSTGRALAIGVTFGLVIGALVAAGLEARRRRRRRGGGGDVPVVAEALAEAPGRTVVTGSGSAGREAVARVARELAAGHDGTGRQRRVIVTGITGDAEAATLAGMLAQELADGDDEPTLHVLRHGQGRREAQDGALDRLRNGDDAPGLTVHDIGGGASAEPAEAGGGRWKVTLVPPMDGLPAVQALCATADEVLLAVRLADMVGDAEDIASVGNVTRVVLFRR